MTVRPVHPNSYPDNTFRVQHPATPPANTTEEEIRRAVQRVADPVKRPAHYTRGEVEVIDFIDQTLDGYTDPRVAHYVGCAIKYLARAPHKGATQQDLEKASWYLTRAINRVASKRG
jgi:hypothetical protein